MRNRKGQICVYVENEKQLQELKSMLENYGEEIDDTMFYITKWESCNYASKWRLDGKWRIGNSDRPEIRITELETILNNEK